MDKKSFAKKYLISIFALYFVGALVVFAVAYGLSSGEIANTHLSLNQCFAVSFLSALVPTGSFAGFCTVGVKIKELNKNQMIILVLFFPLILALLTIFGIIMIIPSIINNIYILLRG